MKDLSKFIRDVPDFPKKGIIFKDITTLLKDEKAFKSAVDIFVKKYKESGIEKVVGVESRGFIFGSAIAYKLGVGFVPARKPGKLPAETLKEEYALEYGTDAVEIHKDAIKKGERILVIDDLLATGGTLSATCRLVEKLGGKIVAVACLIELTFLNGVEKLKGYDFYSVIKC
jgi:adenine phosphoribosyltransferase